MFTVNSGVDVALVAEKLNSSSGEQETDTAINLPHVLIHTHAHAHKHTHTQTHTHTHTHTAPSLDVLLSKAVLSHFLD